MKELQKAALLAALADKLLEQGSWCGETHLQKGTYFLQELLQVPMEFKFILYKHGPFSFDLRDELTAMRADALLELHLQPGPYGPSLIPTPTSKEMRARYAVTLGRYERQLDFAARKLGNKRVAELERLGTAHFVKHHDKAARTAEELAKRIHQLKPHVSVDQALSAIRALEDIVA